jgi:RimJ/RimL family protein N-acetyltransferase
MRYDKHGRPLGIPVENWNGAQPPSAVVLDGRYCRIEPFDAARHGAELRQAFALDVEGVNWAYLRPEPQSDEEWSTWFADMQQSQDPLFFAIIDADSRQATGFFSLMRIDAPNGVIEIGWVLFSPLLQRTRAATEALFLMLRQAFDWGYRRVEWKCNALNGPSERAAKRLGFTFEGVFRQARVQWGLNRDTTWLSLLDHEWPRARHALERWLAPDNFDENGRQRLNLEACRTTE